MKQDFGRISLDYLLGEGLAPHADNDKNPPKSPVYPKVSSRRSNAAERESVKTDHDLHTNPPVKHYLVGSATWCHVHRSPSSIASVIQTLWGDSTFQPLNSAWGINVLPL